MKNIKIFIKAKLSLIVIWIFLLSLSLSVNLFGQQPFFNVKESGAVGDGKTKDTKAIYDAVAACAETGGGTVYFPAGTYLTGPLHIKDDNITLEISAGATLLASDDFLDYPIVYTRWEGIGSYAYCPIIFADSIQNFTLTGRGVIDGNGQKWWDYHFQLRKKYGFNITDFSVVIPEGPLGEELAKLNANSGRDAADRSGWMAQTQFLRPPLVQFYKCQNVLLENLTLINSPFWTVHPLFSDNVVIDKISIDNVTQAGGDSPNTDGINPESSTNIRISNCHINMGDDCIAIKSGRDESGRKVGKPTENLLIQNCTMISGHGGVVIGSEMSGGVRNVVVSNCIFKNTDRGIRIKTMRGRGGTVENIHFQNIIIENARREAIMINMNYHPTPEEPVSERTPYIKNIHISNVTIINAEKIMKMEGLKESPIQDVYLINVVADGKSGVQLSYAKNIFIKDQRFSNAEGKPYIVQNTTGIHIDGQKEEALK